VALQDKQMFGPPGALPPDPPAAPAPRAPLAPVSVGIIAACVAVYLVELLGGTKEAIVEGGQALGYLQYGAIYGPKVAQGEWWRVLATVFEHGSLLHLGFNMSVVWTLGQVLERSIGSARFALVCLITALGASALTLFFAFDHATVGASGMILGWAGTMLPVSTKQGRRSLGIWLIQVVAISLLPGISWQGHLGGFLAGLPCGFALAGGPKRFRWASPVILFLMAVVTVVACSGRFHT
jgi:membrane associated rhomboid family serine protease